MTPFKAISVSREAIHYYPKIMCYHTLEARPMDIVLDMSTMQRGLTKLSYQPHVTNESMGGTRTRAAES